MSEEYVQPARLGIIVSLMARHVTTDSHCGQTKTRLPIVGPATLGRNGIGGANAQEYYDDTESAIMHYALEHYDVWRERLPESAMTLRAPGAFSENISSLGVTEETLCIGDIVKMGSAVLQVASGREACHTMNERFARQDMAFVMHEENRTGWLYRVLEEGQAKPGDDIVLVGRPNPGFTIKRVERCLFSVSMDESELAPLAQMKELATSWRNRFAQRLQKGTPEAVCYLANQP